MNGDRKYPQRKDHDLSESTKAAIRDRIDEQALTSFQIAVELGCSESQVAGIMAAMSRIGGDPVIATSTIQNPLDLPPEVAPIVIPFIADVIDFANTAAKGQWGLTDFQPDVRLNVGWTEVLTTSLEAMRLIVDFKAASSVSLPNGATLSTGNDGGPIYATIPGSACLTLPYSPIETLQDTLRRVRPAFFGAISLAGRRRIGRGAQAGHSSDVVREIGQYVGKLLPQPPYASPKDFTASIAPSAPDSSVNDALALMEGAMRRATTNRYERRPEARAQCTAHYGYSCRVCDFCFVDAFGSIGERFIHVHHTTPIASRGGEYKIDPIRDLIPVCPNCHAMLHRVDPPLTILALRALLHSKRGATNSGASHW